jgi:hypothetical protein
MYDNVRRIHQLIVCRLLEAEIRLSQPRNNDGIPFGSGDQSSGGQSFTDPLCCCLCSVTPNEADDMLDFVFRPIRQLC